MIDRKRTRNTRKETPAPRGPARDWSRLRLACVGIFFAGLWFALWARAWHIQVVQGEWLAENAMRQQKATELRVGRRGDILDRNGQVLARSVEVRSAFARPMEVNDPAKAAKTLAAVLGSGEAEWRKILASKRKFVWLARKITDVQSETLREAIASGMLGGVYLTREYSRVYPFKQLAGQLLGFVGVDDKGLEGLEKTFDEYMTGTSNRAQVQRDASGRKLYLDGVPEHDIEGGNLHLTLDANIQYFAEEALAKAIARYDAKWGGCLVVDVPTGEILAWAEAPFFNPNVWQEYRSSAWRNRLAQDAMEQGSTIKPFVVAAALAEGRAKPDSLYYCEKGKWKFKNVTIRDTTPQEWLTVNKIIRFSSNIGAGKIGLDLGAPKLHEYLTKLGFGARTGLPVPGESRGILREPALWSDVDVASASFGQGFAATGLQMAQAYLALASGGVLRPLKIVRDSQMRKDTPWEDDEDEAGRNQEQRVFSKELAHQIALMMSEVVTEGSGKRARIPGLSVSGKTGTAQKAEGTGYGSGRVASFAGFISTEDPRYLILVMIDEPTKDVYGGAVAAPVFRYVGSRIMAYVNELPSVEGATASTVVVETQPAAETEGVPVVEPAVVGDLVPDVRGKSVRSALELFTQRGIVPKVRGTGRVIVRQEPRPGTPWSAVSEGGEKEGGFTLWLGDPLREAAKGKAQT